MVNRMETTIVYRGYRVYILTAQRLLPHGFVMVSRLVLAQRVQKQSSFWYRVKLISGLDLLRADPCCKEACWRRHGLVDVSLWKDTLQVSLVSLRSLQQANIEGPNDQQKLTSL